MPTLLLPTIRTIPLSVLLGKGDGTFQPKSPMTRGQGLRSVAVGDFTNDGRMDIVATDYVNSAVLVLLGNGDGTFQPAVSENVGDTPKAVAVGDFNNDGNLDIATVNIGDNTASVLLGSGRPPFEDPSSYPVGGTPGAVAFTPTTTTMMLSSPPIPDRTMCRCCWAMPITPSSTPPPFLSGRE